MTLDQAEEAFCDVPSQKSAGRYLRALLEYEADDMIGDDTFLDGLAKIADWLVEGVAP